MRFAAGLASLGIGKGAAVGIMAKSSPQWLAADIGALIAGAVSVPLFTNLAEDKLAFELEQAEIDAIFVDSEEGLQRITPFSSRLTCIICSNTRPNQLANQIGYDALLSRGASAIAENPELIPDLLGKLDPDSVATIIYTSGSSGTPKGVELTHRNLLTQIEGAGLRFPLDPASNRALSCLPLAHVFERMVVYYYLCSGIDLYFVDDIHNLGACLREVRPTVVTMVPRLLEKLYGKLWDTVAASPAPRKQIGRWALNRANARRPDSPSLWKDRLADRLVYSKFRKNLGGEIRWVIAGGAALNPKLHAFYANIGLDVYQGYGLTEASPVLAVNYPGSNRIGTVGPVFPGVELKIGEDGEILARGPNIMKGYHKAESATAQVIDSEGWLHTGDLGRIDGDGFLTIEGRAKELFKTSTGKYVSPLPIEMALSESRFVDLALIVAEGKPFVSALLFIDKEKLAFVRERAGDPQLTDEQALLNPFFETRIAARVERVNQTLNEWERVRAVRYILNAPSVERGEITPTMKLRRHAIEQRYQALIDDIYSEHRNVMSVESEERHERDAPPETPLRAVKE